MSGAGFLRGPSAKAPPPLPFCHLCGRQFGTTSLGIHLKACKERWEREHGRPAPEPDTPMPIGARAGSREWEAFNEAATQKFNDETLLPCPHCGRTFLKDRLAVHLRSCGRGHFAEPKVRSPGGSSSIDATSSVASADDDGAGSSRSDAGATARSHLGVSARVRASTPPQFRPPPASAPSPSARMKGAPPRLPNCHLCGRQFGTTSLGIHLKACKERWEREHGRPAPEPDTPMPIGARAGSREWEAFNEAATQKFNDETLLPCPHCGRTFLKDRLAVHLRSCGRGHFAEPKVRQQCGSGADEDEGTRAAGAFPSPMASVRHSKLGALARQRSESAAMGGVRGEASESEADEYREAVRQAHLSRPDTSADAMEARIKARQAYVPHALGNSQPGDSGTTEDPRSPARRAPSPTARERSQRMGAARAASPRARSATHREVASRDGDLGRRPATARGGPSLPRQKIGGGGGSDAGGAGSSKPSSKERMAVLKELLDAGLITTEEYEGKRKAILDAI